MTRLDAARKFPLPLACSVLALAVFLGLATQQGRAQAAAPSPAAAPAPAAAPNPASAPNPKDIADTWQGTLHVGRDMRMVVKITKADGGGYKAVFYNIDQNPTPLTADSVTRDGSTVKMTLKMIGGSYEGNLSGDGKIIDGSLTLGNPLPLVLTRATPATEWTIPKPPPPIPPMAANADPSFEVATIKPSDPSRRGKIFTFKGTHFITINTNLNDLMAFAYGLHARQIVGAPDWFATELYDIDGVPDAPGRPSMDQTKVMLQKLLADRCQLKFHKEQRELAVYVISVAGTPKLDKTTAGPTDPPGFMFRGLGDLMVRNMTIGSFASGIQATVMDRPVIDKTGLKDKYDFQLKWTPDDSQFAQFRGSAPVTPAKTDDPNAPPSLYTALQEQLGLKMDAVKAPDDVIVIDSVEKPSAN